MAPHALQPSPAPAPEPLPPLTLLFDALDSDGSSSDVTQGSSPSPPPLHPPPADSPPGGVVDSDGYEEEEDDSPDEDLPVSVLVQACRGYYVEGTAFYCRTRRAGIAETTVQEKYLDLAKSLLGKRAQALLGELRGALAPGEPVFVGRERDREAFEMFVKEAEQTLATDWNNSAWQAAEVADCLAYAFCGMGNLLERAYRREDP